MVKFPGSNILPSFSIGVNASVSHGVLSGTSVKIIKIINSVLFIYMCKKMRLKKLRECAQSQADGPVVSMTKPGVLAPRPAPDKGQDTTFSLAETPYHVSPSWQLLLIHSLRLPLPFSPFANG